VLIGVGKKKIKKAANFKKKGGKNTLGGGPQGGKGTFGEELLSMDHDEGGGGTPRGFLGR